MSSADKVLSKSNPKIYEYEFSPEGTAELKTTSFGENWPVVYFLHNDKEIYIGETSNAFQRMKNHLSNEKRKELERMDIVYDPRFNKSAILDIEANLISLVAADQKFKLQNLNSGQDMSHDYYQKGLYVTEKLPQVWKEMRKHNLANGHYENVRNTDLFKFSPFHTLTVEQYDVAESILTSLIEDLQASRSGVNNGQGKTFMVSGSPGTGKTILAIYLLKRINDLLHSEMDVLDLDAMTPYLDALDELRSRENFKIALVVPQTPLRNTLKSVFKSAKGLKANMVIGPYDAVKEDFDVLIVEESHRLKRRKGLVGYKGFDNTAKSLGFDENSTELDWIMAKSRYQVLIYDGGQAVNSSDIPKDKFNELKKLNRTELFSLNSQMRVMGGEDYIRYINQILSDNPPEKVIDFTEHYEFLLFEDFRQLKEKIAAQEASYGLSRIAAGYAWEWKSKKQISKLGVEGYYKLKSEDRVYDMIIDGIPLTWNSVISNWVYTDHSLEEVGCIHTLQGYDLNFAGIIIGNELIYNPETQKIELIRDNFYDVKVKELKDD
ncbi:MAG: DUF2075 domain-containing protein, partial [Erysipelotrichaceae bacterium]|nr:DUF2075 domain-containing protein [Erysipelotrichaceae bacterium]